MDLTREQIENLRERLISYGDATVQERHALCDMALRARAEGEPVGDPERIAQLIAHRACCGAEHDPANGKLHGDCVVCGVPWPCEYAGKPPAHPTPAGMRLVLEEASGIEAAMIAATKSHVDGRDLLYELRPNSSHMIDIHVRRDGKWHIYQGDWLKRLMWARDGNEYGEFNAEPETLKRILEAAQSDNSSIEAHNAAAGDERPAAPEAK